MDPRVCPHEFYAIHACMRHTFSFATACMPLTAPREKLCLVIKGRTYQLRLSWGTESLMLYMKLMASWGVACLTGSSGWTGTTGFMGSTGFTGFTGVTAQDYLDFTCWDA